MIQRFVLSICFTLLSLATLAQSNNSISISEIEKTSFEKKASFNTHQLSYNYDILYHNIHWYINPAKQFIQGRVSSLLRITSDSTNLLFFDLADNLQIDSIVHNDTLLAFKHENECIQIQFTNYLYKDAIDSVAIYYRGIPSTSGFGSFETNIHDGIPILWTLSEPYGAKEWWPCKQTLSDKVDSLDIMVTVPLGNKVASNGVLIDSIKTDSSISYCWKHQHPIATYLIAIAVTNYHAYNTYAMVSNVDSVEILNYVYPESYTNTREVIEYTNDLITLFSDKFTPYPFYKEKYGHAQIGWNGGMEHQTMSFMGAFTESLIAHELAHQWFGDYVTCGSWQDIWINEGFAVFGEGIALEYLHPDDFNVWIQNRIMHICANAKTGSIFVEDTTNISRLFDNTLSYQKAGMVLHQLRHQIGDEAFFNGIKIMMIKSKNNGGFAKTDDVKHCFEEASDSNLYNYFEPWIYGEGYPKFTIDFNQDEALNVNIALLQTPSSTKTLFFPLYVPIEFSNDSISIIKRFHHLQNHQQFTFNPGFKVKSIRLDPNYTLITKRPANIRYEIDEILSKEKIIISPNPTKHSISLMWSDQIKVNKIEIYSMKGKRVYIEPLYDGRTKHTISVKRLKNGQYLLKAFTNKNVITKKFIRN